MVEKLNAEYVFLTPYKCVWHKRHDVTARLTFAHVLVKLLFTTAHANETYDGNITHQSDTPGSHIAAPPPQ